jgi:hypothetical protein
VAEIRRSPAARSARRGRGMAYRPPGLGFRAWKASKHHRRGGSAAGRSAGHWSTRAGDRGGVFRATSECGDWGVLGEAPKGLAGDRIEGEVEFHGGGHGGRRRSKEQWRAHTCGETSGARF